MTYYSDGRQRIAVTVDDVFTVTVDDERRVATMTYDSSGHDDVLMESAMTCDRATVLTC